MAHNAPIEAKAWKNHRGFDPANTFGLSISPKDRDARIPLEWQSVTLNLPNGRSVIISVSSYSFRHSCPEFRSREIKKWLFDSGLAPWPDRRPPKILLTERTRGVFDVVVVPR